MLVNLVIDKLLKCSHSRSYFFIFRGETVDISLSENTFKNLFVCASQSRRRLTILFFCDQEGRYSIFFYQLPHIFKVWLLLYAYRIGIHKYSWPFNFLDFVALFFNRHKSMNDSQSSISCHLNCHPSFSDCIHWWGDNRNIERDTFGKIWRNVTLCPNFHNVYLESISPYWGTSRMSLKVRVMGIFPF